MSTIIKSIINIIGLGKLLESVWEIAYDELLKVAQKSPAEWDDKAVAIVDQFVKAVIQSLTIKK